MDKTRKIQSIIQDVIEGRKDNNEATINIIALCDVVNQRELLIAFKNKVNDNCSNANYDIQNYVVDDFLSNL